MALCLDDKVWIVLGGRTQINDFGIEVEVEGENLPDIVKGWTTHHDGSLRGNSMEYLLPGPLGIDKCKDRLEYLQSKLSHPDVIINKSNRTSVHIHRNVQELTIRQIYNICTLYFIFEIPMTEYAGKERIGNVYCLRAVDAEFLIFEIIDSIQNLTFLDNFNRNDEIRYSGLNLTSIPTFGSVEFRAFRGTIIAKDILNWMLVIEALFQSSLKYRNPKDIVSHFLEVGPEKFLSNIMPNEFVLHVLNFTDYKKTMKKGFLYSAEIANATEDWNAKIDDDSFTKSPPPRKRRVIPPIPQNFQVIPQNGIFNVEQMAGVPFPEDHPPVPEDDDRPEDHPLEDDQEEL